jgi:hypothetical protein
MSSLPDVDTLQPESGGKEGSLFGTAISTGEKRTDQASDARTQVAHLPVGRDVSSLIN